MAWNKKRLLWLLVLPPLAMVGMSVASCSVPALGLENGRLTALPDKPNCVSSLAEREAQRVAPLTMRGDLPTSLAALKEVVFELPRATLLDETEDYLRFQFSSLVFRFKDDLEFHLLPADKVIHVRAAARVGHSDFGVNRARVEAIRAKWKAR
jgi:uncharacterized protein (DUF1499 family)